MSIDQKDRHDRDTLDMPEETLEKLLEEIRAIQRTDNDVTLPIAFFKNEDERQGILRKRNEAGNKQPKPISEEELAAFVEEVGIDGDWSDVDTDLINQNPDLEDILRDYVGDGVPYTTGSHDRHTPARQKKRHSKKTD